MADHKSIIQKKLQQLEQEHDIRILMACESGSRAWGFPSQDSDYDVRFIYAHPPLWYLGINQARDVLQSLGELYDFSGWDLRKAMHLTRNGNCALSEWLSSPILYHQLSATGPALTSYMEQCFLPRKACHHYLAMSQNKLKQIQEAPHLNAKHYFYALRTALCAVFITRHKAIPPITLDALMDEIMADHKLRPSVEALVATKQQGEESSQLAKDPALIQLIENLIQETESHLPLEVKKLPYEDCNPQFQKILGLCWQITQFDLQ